MKKSVSICAYLWLAIAALGAGGSISTNKTFVVNTDNVLPPNETNFFAVNSNLLNQAVAPSVGGGGSGGGGGGTTYNFASPIYTNGSGQVALVNGGSLTNLQGAALVSPINQTNLPAVALTNQEANQIIFKNQLIVSSLPDNAGTALSVVGDLGGDNIAQFIDLYGYNDVVIDATGTLNTKAIAAQGLISGDGAGLTNLHGSQLVSRVNQTNLPSITLTNHNSTSAHFGGLLYADAGFYESAGNVSFTQSASDFFHIQGTGVAAGNAGKEEAADILGDDNNYDMDMLAGVVDGYAGYSWVLQSKGMILFTGERRPFTNISGLFPDGGTYTADPGDLQIAANPAIDEGNIQIILPTTGVFADPEQNDMSWTFPRDGAALGPAVFNRYWEIYNLSAPGGYSLSVCSADHMIFTNFGASTNIVIPGQTKAILTTFGTNIVAAFLPLSTNLQASQLTGTVAASHLPALSALSGTISMSQLPAAYGTALTNLANAIGAACTNLANGIGSAVTNSMAGMGSAITNWANATFQTISAITPADYTNNLGLWLDATQIPPTNGGSFYITNWVNLATGTSFVSNNACTYALSNSFFRGHPMVYLNGGAQTLCMNTTPGAGYSNSITIFCVKQHVTDTTSGALRMILSDNAEAWRYDGGNEIFNGFDFNATGLTPTRQTCCNPRLAGLEGTTNLVSVDFMRFDGTNIMIGDGLHYYTYLMPGTFPSAAERTSLPPIIVGGYGAVPSSFGFTGGVGEIRVYHEALSASNINTVATALFQKWSLPTNPAPFLIETGDSISAGYYAVPITSLITDQVPGPLATLNLGVNGNRMTNMIHSITNSEMTLFAPGQNITFLVWGGRNDFETDGMSALTVASNTLWYCSLLHNMGAHVVLNDALQSSQDQVAGGNAVRLLYNQLLYSGFPPCLDAVVPVSQFPPFSTGSSFTNVLSAGGWTQDGIHPLQGAQAVATSLDLAVFNRIGSFYHP